MSVLIKGIEMPNSCLDCPCNLNLFFCRACDCREIDQTGIRHEDGNIVVKRPDWCPLVEQGECQKCYQSEERGCAIFCREWNRYVAHKGYCYRYTKGRIDG